MTADNLGSHKVDYVELDASTSAAGQLAFDPEADSGLDDPMAVEVVEKDATAKAYQFDWAAEGDYFHVVNVADGTDVADATDVGVVTVRAEGRR